MGLLFLVVPEPVAFYPLNARYKAAEKENRQPKGTLGDVSITNGPYNEPGGAYMFYGTVSSYIEFPNRGGLEPRFSITLMCWVRPGGHDGPLFSYGKDGRGVRLEIRLGLFTLIVPQNNPQIVFQADLKLFNATFRTPKGLWVHVAATFDHNTGLSSMFINGHLSATKKGFTGSVISTNAGEVRMGVTNCDDGYFKGKIAELKVYDVALSQAQIQTTIVQGNLKIIVFFSCDPHGPASNFFEKP